MNVGTPAAPNDPVGLDRPPFAGPAPARPVDFGRAAGHRPVAMVLLLAHVPLGITMKLFPVVDVVYVLVVVGLGLFWAVRGSVERVAYFGAYVASAEILCRMCEFQLLGELGKYLICLTFLITLLRTGLQRLPWGVLAYFLLLLPSVAIVLDTDIRRLRNDLSFNLSGALTLVLASTFYSQLAISRDEVEELLLTFLTPVVGISGIALLWTATSDQLKFNGESNFVTSGGFGPNQVSAILGMGAVAAVLCYLVRPRGGAAGLFLIGLALLLMGQSALTFSRTGLYGCGCALLAAAVSMSRDPRVRLKLMTAAVVAAAFSVFVALPFLNSLTGGRLEQRFTEKGYSGREDLLQGDLEAFLENPLLGVGPGGSRAFHVHGKSKNIASHSEITRLIAEHGMLGVAAIAMLLLTATANYRRQRTVEARGICAALITWSLFIMTSNAMRYAAPALFFGLCCASFSPEPDESESSGPSEGPWDPVGAPRKALSLEPALAETGPAPTVGGETPPGRPSGISRRRLG